MKRLVPQRPTTLDALAKETLARLASEPDARNLVLGGQLALKHYVDYRMTHDIGAWWSTQADPAARDETLATLRTVMQHVAREHGLELDERRRVRTDVVSFELSDPATKRKVFSVQVAPRDVELEPPLVDESPWKPLAIETLEDNLGSKMTALVQRGAARDFIDVYEVAQRGVASLEELWSLWQRKNPRGELELAKAEVARNLAAIELTRPLEGIASQEERAATRARREWFYEVLQETPERSLELGYDDPGIADDDFGLDL